MVRGSFIMGLSTDDGQDLSGSGTFDAEASEMIKVTIPHGSVETTVDVQPVTNSLVRGLIIVSDNYVELTYKVDSVVTVRTLDKPLICIGAGSLAFLGATFNKLKFTNAGTTVNANVRILVLRDAIEAGS